MKTKIGLQTEPMATPYCVKLPDKLSELSSIVIKGKRINGPEQRFTISLTSGPEPDSTILLNYDVQAGQDRVVLNTRGPQGWEDEQVEAGKTVDVGQDYTLAITVMEGMYKCYMKGSQRMDYEHRLPFQDVTHIRFTGDTLIQQIVFKDETMPFSMPCSIAAERKIYVSGVPNGNKFSIYLSRGPDALNDDVAMSVDVRFDSDGDVDCVVLNSKEFMDWQDEERPETFPFFPERYFSMYIKVREDSFKISVNDRPFAEFKHRLLPLVSISHIHVLHEILLQNLHIL